jgi:phosphatidylserine/phosphatidylglycerophosphate/cardiolipin synthase-like enzyme
MLKFVEDMEIYQEVICGIVLNAKRSIWIGTSDLKDMHVLRARGKTVPLLQELSELITSHVKIRLVHAKEPGPNFRQDFDKFPNLVDGLERMLCPRIHFKTIIVDQRIAYLGSANLTGAGMGAKASGTRNFENGIVTDDPEIVGRLTRQFDTLWMGAKCDSCKRKAFCLDRVDVE